MARESPTQALPAASRAAPPPAPGSAPEFPLLAHVDRLMQDLHARVPAALNEWAVEGIHQARVATRRLKAALDLMEPVLGRKRRQPLARTLRRLRRRLGPLRDTDVILEHLQAVAASTPKHAPAARWLERHLLRKREGLREESRDAGPAARVLQDLGTWHPVRAQIVEGRAAVPRLLAESLHRQLDAFVDEAARVLAAIQPAGAPGEKVPGDHAADRPDPHQLRIAGKALRYTLEMAVAAGHGLPSSVLKTFKGMQEKLGTWHDFVVLSDTAMAASLEELLSHRDADMQEKVLALACLAVRRSARELQQFVRLWTAKGEALASAVSGAFAVTGSGTDPGPPGSAPAPAPAAAPGAGPSAVS